MVCRFDEPIQVQFRSAGDLSASGSGQGSGLPAHDETPLAEAPSAFVWRGRIYAVRSIDGHWHERRSWWHEDPSGGRGTGDRRVWRVRAQAGRLGTPGIFELGSDGPGAAQPWLLLRAHD